MAAGYRRTSRLSYRRPTRPYRALKRRGNTISKPYGSVYDNDYHQKISFTGEIKVDAGGTGYIQMRTDNGASTANDLALFDQPEF